MTDGEIYMKYVLLSLLLFLLVGCGPRTRYNCKRNTEKMAEYMDKCIDKCKECNTALSASNWYDNCEGTAIKMYCTVTKEK